MKHWTLFTLRMMARVGLFLAVLLWWYSQSTVVAAASPIGSRGIGGAVYPFGVLVYHTQRPTVVSWTCIRLKATDRDEFSRKIQEYFPKHRSHIPGVYYSTDSTGPGITLVGFRHWLLVLTFLIATIATSVRWKRKRVAEQQGAAPVENRA